jgi:hypothetical protein
VRTAQRDRPTPETDVHAPWRYAITTPNGVTTQFVPADFARKLERERDDAKQIARDLCETISYLAPDLLDRHGYTFEKAAVIRCMEVLNEDPEAHFRKAAQ